MKRGFLIIIFLLCCGPIMVFAQDDDSDDNRVITVFIDSQFSEDTDALNTLIEQLEVFLIEQAEAESLNVELESDPDFATIYINFDLLSDGSGLFIDLLPIPPDPGVLPSPSLVSHVYSEFPLGTDPDNDLWPQITTQMVFALSTYIQGDCEAAQTYLSAAVDASSQLEDYLFLGAQEQTEAYAMFYEANCALEDEDYETAETLYRDILTLYEDNDFDMTLYGYEARINLAWALYQLGETDEAFEIVQEASVVQFEWIEADALIVEADMLAQEEDYTAALDRLDSASDIINIDDPFLKLATVQIRIQAEDYKGAEGELTQIEKEFEGLPELLYYWGLLAYAQDDFDTASDYFQDYIGVSPDSELAIDAQAYIDEIEGS
jgi:tetratricopeptide (TPR) repeat protein